MSISFTMNKDTAAAGATDDDEFDGMDLNEFGDEDDEAAGEATVTEDLLEEEDDEEEELGFYSDDDDEDNLFEDDEEDEPQAKPARKAKAPKDDLTQRALARLLEQTAPKAETPATETNADEGEESYEDWSKGIMTGSQVQVPPEYLAAIREGDPAQASKALNALLAHQTSKVLAGVDERMQKQIDARIKKQETEQNTARQQQQAAQQTQVAIEQNFASNYAELNSLSSHPELGQYLSLAVQAVSGRADTRQMTDVGQFTKAVATEAAKLLKPVLAAGGMKFTKANLVKLAGQGKRQKTVPPAPLGGGNKRGQTNRRGTPDGEMFDFRDL